MFKLNSRVNKIVSVLVGAALSLTMLITVDPARADFSPPVMATINPSSGTVTGGDLVTITGQNLRFVNTIMVGDQAVWWNEVERSPIGEWITFRTPYSNKTGPVDITLMSTVNVTEPDFFTYTPSSITSVSPGLGTSRGGTSVTIKGTGFGPMEWGDSSLIVKFNGVLATGVKRVSPTQITAVTPAGNLGDATVEISFAYDWQRRANFSANVISQAKAYLYTPEVLAPKVDSITPDRGSISGGNEVTVSGRYLRGSNNQPATFSFGGALATNVVVSQDGTSATMTTPARPAGAVDVVVTSSDSSTTIADGFTYSSAPTITSVSPATGVNQGGTLVTINGTNFGASGIPTVKFGDTLALCVKLVSPTQITAVTRDNIAGPVDVSVTPTTGGGTATRADSYTYQAATVEPVISSVTPDSGPTTGANTVEFKTTGVFPAGTPNVMFGSACALTVTRVDDKTIRATAPSNPAGPRNVSITFANGYSFLANGYTYFVPTPPAITTVTPAVDWTQGGTTVTITGLGFGTTGTPVVKFGTVTATNVNRISNTQLTVTVPANTAGAKEVSVTPAGGTPITKSGAFTYKAPVISSVKPNSGVVLGGTNVVIYGDGFGFSGTPVVKFGGKLATNVVRIDNRTLSATTPSGTKGFTAVEITPQGAVAISSSTVYAYFELQVAPQIDASSLTWLPAAGGSPVTVRGSNFIGSDGKAGKVYVNGALITATVAAGGKSVTFTSPALAPSNGAYEFRIVTNEGTAWKAIFRVAMPPGPPPGGCDFNTAGGRNIDSGGSRTLYLSNNSLMLGELGNPTVTVNGTESGIVVAGNTGGNNPKDFVTFDIPTTPAIPLGDVSVVVKLGQNAGSVTSDCFYRRGNITITPNDKTIMFGQEPGAFLRNVEGERGTDKITGVTLVFKGIDGTVYPESTTVPTAAGRYQIRPTNAVMNPGNINNYDVYYRDGLFVIQGIPVVVKAIQCNAKVYGDPNPNISFSQTGLPPSESIKSSSVAYVYEGTTLAGFKYGPTTAWPTRAGSYTITPKDAQLNSANTASISFSYESCDYEITKRPVSIKAPDTTKVYGAADPAKAWVFTDSSNKNLAPGDTTLNGAVNVDRNPGENVGSYDYISANFDALNPDYEITYSYWGKLTITKKTISVTGTNTTKNYCQPDPEFTYTSSGLVFGDRLSGSLSRVAGNNLGDYAYTNGTLNGGDNYIISSISGGKLTITPCPLDLQADYQEKIYGEADPTLTYSNVGAYDLINGDTLTGAITRAAGTNVGNYTISKGTLASSANYTINFRNGTLAITKRPICVSTDNKSKVYGNADPVFTRALVTNANCLSLIGSDSLSGSLSREAGNNVGYYAITPGSLTAGSNYDLSVTSGELEITKRPITITPAAKSKTYGDSDPTLTVSVTTGSLAYTDSLVGSISRDEGENVGSYNYQLGNFGDYNPNYDITVNNTNKFTINKKRITVTGIDTQKYYGESDPELRYNSSGLVWGDTLSGSLGRATGETVGNYNYTAGTLSGGNNYIIDSVSGGKLVIAKRPIDVCAYDKSKTYGEADPTLNYEICGEFGLVGSDAFTGALSRAAGTNVGNYAIGKNTLALSANYTLNFYGATLTITPKTIYLNAANKTKVYGNSDPALTYTLAPGYAWVGSDNPTVTLGRDSGEDVDFYDINVKTVTGGSNYEIYVNSGNLEITKRAITIKPNAKTKVYGAFDPDFTAFGASDYTVTVGSLKSGDSLYLAFGRDSGENVGSYNFTSGDLNAYNTNYNITVDSTNKFTITARPITVTAYAQTKQYGESDPGLDYALSSYTLPNGEDVVLNGSLTRTAGEGVNAVGYDITQGTVTNPNNTNYSITYVGAKLKVTKRDLYICANSQFMTYGDSRPANSFYICDGGTAFSDAVSSVTFTYSTANPVNVGEYRITPSAAVFSTGSAANYNIYYDYSFLNIYKKQISVKAADKTKVYGNSDPALTYSITSGSLVGSDSFTGALTRSSGEDVDSYSILQGTLTAGNNYDLNFTEGELTITKRAITIKPNAKTKVYGAFDPDFTAFGASDYTVTVGSLKSGDSLYLAFGRDSGENVGSYNFTSGDLNAYNTNYNITVDSTNKFTITVRNITVTADAQTKTFGDSDPALTYSTSIETLPNGTEVSLSGALTRTAGENVGDWNINQGTVTSANNTNYNISYVGAKLKVNKKDVTICADDKSMTYGDSRPANSAGVCQGTNFVGSDALGSVSYTYSTPNPVNAGDYSITPSAAVLSTGLLTNYNISYSAGTLSIDKKAITVTATDKNKVYGNADPAFTHSLTSGSLVGSDSITGSLTRETGNDVGEYEIQQGSLTAGNNYDLTFRPGTLTIGKRDITVKPNSHTKAYGDIDPTFTFTVSVGNLAYSDRLSGSLARVAGQDVDTYAYTLGDFVASNPNYNISLDSTNNFSITKKSITVTAEAKSKKFGDSDPALTYTTSVTSLPNGLTVSLNGDLTRAVGENVGDWNITQGSVTNANNTNYTINFVGGKLTVNKRDVSVCADSKIMTYGETRPANSAALCDGFNFVGSDSLGSVSYTYSTGSPVNVGSYDITPSAAVMSSGSAANYNFSYVKGALTINKRQITVTAADKTKKYGQSDPAFTFSITSGTLVGSDSFSGTLSRATGENVGDYSITLGSLGLGNNYDLSLGGGKLTIEKRSVKVTPSPNQKKTYSQNDPTFTYTTDIVLPFSESLVGALGRDLGEDVGDYAYNLGTIADSNSNYDITLDTANKFKIEKFVVTITVNNLEKIYGEADPAYTYTFSPEKLANGNAITVSGSPTRAPGENVGDYVISVGSLDAGSNFTANITAGAKLTIKKRPITVTAGDQTMVYGGTIPTNSVSVTSGTLVGSETVSGASYTYSTNPPRNVGDYQITPSAAVVSGGLASNYSFSYESGTLTVTKAELKIYLFDSNSDWGDKIVPAGAKYSEGLKNNDKVGTFNYTFDGSAEQPTLPGEYVLDGTVATFSAGTPDNYEITIVPATYTVNAPFYVNMDPKRGPEAGGTAFTIYGFGFGLNSPIVKFDGIEATNVKLVGSSQITGLTPAHPAGLVSVTLETEAGVFELGNIFTYVPPKPTPQIYALAPTQGTVDGGTKVTVSGTAFKGTDGKPAQVYIDGVQVSGVKVSNDGKSLVFVTPPHAAGKVDVKVVTKEGSFTFAQGYEYIAGLMLDLDLKLEVGAKLVGQTVTLKGGGLKPLSDYTLELFSDPVLIYKGQADERGNFLEVVEMPGEACVGPGQHTFKLTGIQPNNEATSDEAMFHLRDDCIVGQGQAVKNVVKGKVSWTLSGFLFKYRDATLTAEAKASLNSLLKIIKGAKNVTISGYTETDTKSPAIKKSNLKLAKDRCDSVMAYLKGKGLKAKYQLFGRGGVNPVSLSNQSLNRRVVIEATF